MKIDNAILNEKHLLYCREVSFWKKDRRII